MPRWTAISHIPGTRAKWKHSTDSWLSGSIQRFESAAKDRKDGQAVQQVLGGVLIGGESSGYERWNGSAEMRNNCHFVANFLNKL